MIVKDGKVELFREIQARENLFQYCFSSQKKNPRKILIIRLLRGFYRTQSRDRTGMEVNPLVFETSASTNSAIWAIVGTKVRFFFEQTNENSINN